jgi:acetyl esterase/lipase
MTEATRRHEIATRPVLYMMPGTGAVTVRRYDAYRVTDAGPLGMDIYYPPGARDDARTPAVIFVVGYSEIGAEAVLGCSFGEMEYFQSWARFVAASGMAAITYRNREPVSDLDALIEHVRESAASLGIDRDRIGVFACSGHGPCALALLMSDRAYVKCAVLCYAYMMDLDGSSGVAEAARKWKFVNPCGGKSVDDVPMHLPLFIARAGQDSPDLNGAIDRFVTHALWRNLPITLVNHAQGPHAFDLYDDSETTREIVRQILAFLRFRLSATP